VNRRGIALPMVLGVLVALGLLSALSLADATRDWRVATLAQDALLARAAALSALAAAGDPPDLAVLCSSGPMATQVRVLALDGGSSATLGWRALQPGLVRADIEGRGLHGARHRLQAYLAPDSAERVMGLFRCPTATRLVPAAGRWLDGHPEG
jgi:hypothetical protein